MLTRKNPKQQQQRKAIIIKIDKNKGNKYAILPNLSSACETGMKMTVK